MASHEELLAEMPKLEKMSNAARLKLAKKRRALQMKKFLEVTRCSGGTQSKKKSSTKVNFEKCSLLHDAVQRNNMEEVEQLLKDGVCCNINNADGLTPLHRCCIENTVDLAQLLIDNGADIGARDIEGWTPLHAASACGNLQMLNLLVSSGASLVAINLDDKMPIDVACDADIRYIMQQKMLEAGYTDDVCKYIRDSVAKTMLADLKECVNNNESVLLTDKYGGTSLHVAAANGYVEVMEFLLSQPKIDINVQDNEGWTPFHAAVCWEQVEIMKLLASRGANLEKQDIHGDTPYAVAEEADIRQLVIELKLQYTAPRSLAVSPSCEESTPGTTRHRVLSVRRYSQSDKHVIKKKSSLEEQMFRQETMEAEDIERTASGEHMDDDRIMADIERELNTNCEDVTNSTINDKDRDSFELNPRHSSTSLTSMEREMREAEQSLDGGRKKIVSILKNSNPTPVNRDSVVKFDEELPPPPSRPRRSGGSDECCVIL